MCGEKRKIESWKLTVNTALFKADNEQGPTVQHSLIFYNNLNGKTIQKRIDFCIWTTESLHCTPETSQHCKSTILQYKKCLSYTSISKKCNNNPNLQNYLSKLKEN